MVHRSLWKAQNVFGSITKDRMVIQRKKVSGNSQIWKGNELYKERDTDWNTKKNYKGTFSILKESMVTRQDKCNV